MTNWIELLLCIDCGKNEAADEYNERCATCAARYEANREPPDPPGWEGGFADNH